MRPTEMITKTERSELKAIVRQQKVELVWVGTNLEGIHVWEVTTKPHFDDVKGITIEVMPPYTQIHIGGPGGP